MNQTEKVVLITGASGGIGQAIVRVFADQDWYVIGIDRNPFIDEYPENGHFIQADITLLSEMKRIFKGIQSSTLHLHALVNNAAVSVAKSLLETTMEEWDAIMAANLRSVFMGVKFAYSLLIAAPSSAIVNVSSVHAVATSANMAAYAASKGGLLALTRAMAIEFASDNIRVNAILPGAVDTKMLRDNLSQGFPESVLYGRLENLAEKTVIGRIGEPEEIAQAVYFLADHAQSSFMTAQAIIVDGGATARLSTE